MQNKKIHVFLRLQEVLMAHGLRRVSYATCDPGSKQFCFLARQPGGHINKQYCHLFVTKTAEQVRFSIYRLTLVFILYLIRSYGRREGPIPRCNNKTRHRAAFDKRAAISYPVGSRKRPNKHVHNVYRVAIAH